MKRDYLETSTRENSTKNSLIVRFYQEKSQEFFVTFSAHLPTPKTNFQVGKFQFKNKHSGPGISQEIT